MPAGLLVHRQKTPVHLPCLPKGLSLATPSRPCLAVPRDAVPRRCRACRALPSHLGERTLPAVVEVCRICRAVAADAD